MLARTYRALEEHAPPGLKALFPRPWRIWLGYQVKVIWGQYRPKPLSTPAQPLTFPPGESEASIRRLLAETLVKSEGRSAERQGYLEAALRRLVQTLHLVPPTAETILEVGGAPYLMTTLLKRFHTAQLTVINFFGGPVGRGVETLVSAAGAEMIIEYDHLNVETDRLPYVDGQFDVVLLCEVLEHFTNDPLPALLEIKRVLKPDGVFVLTTPNAVRLENAARVLAGENPFDAYSAYGPPGRHNREYTPQEVIRLLDHCGFTVEEIFTADALPPARHLRLPEVVQEQLHQVRAHELGEYIFVRSNSSHTANHKKPAWLYRSYPAHTTT